MTEMQTIEKVDFNDIRLDDEYYKCVFEGCNFSGDKMLNTNFENCQFRGCNFALTKFGGIIRDAGFSGCKMTGSDFANISKFSGSVRFKGCQLNYASFSEVKMRG